MNRLRERKRGGSVIIDGIRRPIVVSQEDIATIEAFESLADSVYERWRWACRVE